MIHALAAPAPAPGRAPAHATSIFEAARLLMPLLAAGQPLGKAAIRRSMTAAFAANDASSAWSWKDAYEAAEAAMVLFIRQYGTALARHAADDGPGRMLAMLETAADLEPSHTRRSEQQVRLQQFSTPVPLAYAALQAAAIGPEDTVLEPSAGTGVLAALAFCALGGGADRALHLNEWAETRSALLRLLFPGASVTSLDAETVADRLPGIRPTVVVMNPPFSASPGAAGPRRGADLRHVRSAFSLLPPGGRLAAITSAGCLPGNEAWRAAFDSLEPPARIAFTSVIDGRLYARRGTNVDTRLTVLDRSDAPSAAVDPFARASSARDLLDRVTCSVPPRLPVVRSESRPIAAPGGRFGNRSPALAPAAPRSAATPDASAHDWGPIAPLAFDDPPANANEPAPAEASAGPYEPWRPGSIRVAGAPEHPTPLVQTSAMAAVTHPPAAYRPLLPTRIVTQGLLSDAQLESVVLAGEAHSRRLAALYRIGSGWETVRRWNETDSPDSETGRCPPLPDTDSESLSQPVQFRRGWMLGDGTGCGKGRQVAGILIDNWLRGRTRALWLSQSDKLVEDAGRDWTATGGRASDVVPISRFKQDAVIPLKRAVLFSTYATLRSPSRQGRRSRLEQIVEWLAGSLDEADRHAFDGVIVFDECHAMANAAGARGKRGAVKPSQQGRAGLRLQNALPNARIVYVSATGASTVPGLAYAVRLGLWGAGETPFETRAQFVEAMEAGGVAAMEVVARDLKALGLYQARALSYRGVEVDILEHTLTPEQRRIYDSYADAFQIIHNNLQAALRESGIMQGDNTLNRNAKAAALSAFESMKQRFFGHLLTGMQCPSLIRAVEADLDAGRSAVIQLVSTGEALMERRIAEIPASEWNDLSIDLTPRDGVLSYLQYAFPVQLYDCFTDDEGNPASRLATDEDGNPILSQDALQRRQALIERLASLPPVPTALDRIVHHFGHEAVAEITGRSRRILRIEDRLGDRLCLRNRPASANRAEAASFMQGAKRILVFSMAGGTGRSYHADLACPNTERRVHYLLEPGWRADQAIQGLGRTHRTHQASAPLFRPVATDVKGQRRFISTIARRLDSLGAITRGQRNSQSSMGAGNASLFRERDNLESPYAIAALRMFFIALHHGHIPEWSTERFQDATGLKIAHEGSLKDELPPMPRFLNRLLALRIDDQNQLFAKLEELIDANIEAAVQAGTYELGVETVHADSAVVLGIETLRQHLSSGTSTELTEIRARNRTRYATADEALRTAEDFPPPEGLPSLVLNTRSRRAAVLVPAPSRILEDGSTEPCLRLLRPNGRQYMGEAEFRESNWQAVPERRWRAAWTDETAGLPTHNEYGFHLATGLLLPVWDRIKSDDMRIRKIATDDGRTLIGRYIAPGEARAVRRAFGLDTDAALTAEEAHATLLGNRRSVTFDNGWKLFRRRNMGLYRMELHGPDDRHLPELKRLGCATEIVHFTLRVYVPDLDTLARILERWPAND